MGGGLTPATAAGRAAEYKGQVTWCVRAAVAFSWVCSQVAGHPRVRSLHQSHLPALTN